MKDMEIGVAGTSKTLLTARQSYDHAEEILLNMLLNIINYLSGWLSFVFYYFRYEFYVLIIEAVLYCALFNKVSQTAIPKWKAIVYALPGNIVSFICRFFLSLWIPEIF